MKRALTAALAMLPAAAYGAPRVLTLEEALRTAQAHQPQLEAARALVRAGQARVGEARAGFLPRVDGSFQYQRSTANFTLSPAFAGSPLASSLVIKNRLSPSDTVNYYLFGANISQTIYDFGRTGGTFQEAREGEIANRADLETADGETALGVRVSFFGVLATKELVWVGEETVKNQGKHVAQVREFVSAGTRPKIDLRSAELNLANAELALVRAKNQLDLARVGLNQAMGVAESIDYDVSVPEAVALAEETQLIDALLADALRARPEVVKIDAQLRVQAGARTVARAGFFPAVVALGNLSGTKVTDTSTKDFDWGLNWYVGLGLTWNLYAGSLNQHQIEEADANAAALAAQREALKQNIRADLEQQLLSVSEAKQRLQVAERAVGTAEERLKLAEGRYQAGAGDILELDDAQVTLANAQAQRVQANYDIATARARLAHALGRK